MDSGEKEEDYIWLLLSNPMIFRLFSIQYLYQYLFQ